MFFTDFFSIGTVLAMDLFSIERSLFTFVGSIFLPVLLCVVLVSALGGNGQDMAQSVGETLAACLAMVLELGLRLGLSLFVAFTALLSALVRLALSWGQHSKIKIRTGPDSDTDGGVRSGNMDKRS